MRFSRLLLGMILWLMLLQVVSSLSAQDFYDVNQVNTIRLYFTQSNWDQLLDNLVAAGQEERLLGTAVINGVTYDSVGVRYKGNSSYSASRNKNPFNIKLDYVHDNQLLQGVYGTIKLSNGFNDPSLVRETLSYEIARKYMPASGANYANLYVNDQLIGVYTSIQDVDSYFMETHLACSGKPRFKCENNPTGNPVIWGYLGTDSLAYAGMYEMESDYGWAQLIDMLYTLNNDQNNIAGKLNVDRHLWLLAFENLLDNFDSPINIFHNFYLFGDEDGRFNPIIWDLNESFGVFNHVGMANLTVTQLQNYDPLANISSSIHPLISRILSNPRYKKMYIAHMRTMITENFSNGWYSTRATELQSVCGPSVQTDPNFFFSYANFQSNINTTITLGRTFPGITQLMNARATFLLNNTAFAGTVPAISALNHYPETVPPNSTVRFTLTASNATYAQLGIRQSANRKFDYYQMFDDGLHGDGNANDGVFGIAVTVGYGNVQYYGWAENTAQGAFYPARAEYEFLTLETTSQTGGIMFSEINYNSADTFNSGDWVELYNPGPEAIDVSNWVFKDGSDTHIFTLPQSTIMGADSYLVLCESAVNLQTCYPGIANFAGDFSFGLSSSGEAVRLYTSSGALVDSVLYGVVNPWPTEPDGNGPTLELISPDLDNSLATSWQASQGHGTPGSANSNVFIDENTPVVQKDNLKIYPNPFSGSSTILFKNDNLQNVEISVYNLCGARIRTLINSVQGKGDVKINWDGTDDRQRQAGNGIYFIRLKEGNGRLTTRKVVLLR